MELRPYQRAALNSARAMMRSGARSVLICIPTGGGKGAIAAHALASCAALGKTGLFVVHRQELVRDIAGRLRREGLDRVGIEMGSESCDADASVVVGTVQTLSRRKYGRVVHLAVVDEAHHAVTGAYTELLARLPDVRIVGLTATPCRADETALGDVFERLIVAATIADLTPEYLVPCRVYAPVEHQSELAAHPADAHSKWLAGRRTVWFAKDREHARQIAAELCLRGVRALSVSAIDPDRDERIARFRSGEVEALVNVHLLTEGFDLPEITGVGIARDVSHDGAWLQIVGRGLRIFPGKSDCLVVDLCGASRVFGPPSVPRTFSLEGRPIRVAAEGTSIRQCKSCGLIFMAAEWGDAGCPGCGEVSRRRDPKVVRAELEEVRMAKIERQTSPTSIALFLRIVADTRAEAEATGRQWKVGSALFRFKGKAHRFPNSIEKKAAGL